MRKKVMMKKRYLEYQKLMGELNILLGQDQNLQNMGDLGATPGGGLFGAEFGTLDG